MWLTDFRNHEHTDLLLSSKVTLIVGLNGHGKTNLIEAIHLLSGAKSFRGAKVDALVMHGKASAYVRAEVERGDNTRLVELQFATAGRSKAQVNRQKLKRFRDLGDTVRVVVFSPDDLELLKGAPSVRRAMVDEVIAASDIEFRAVRTEFDQILRQRNNLLKQAKGQYSSSIQSSLDIWNEQFLAAGEAVAEYRKKFLVKLGPVVQDFYAQISDTSEPVSLFIEGDWQQIGMKAALEAARADEFRRGMTLIGPHRDDITILLDSLPSRTHASQGEQRSLALALRLAIYLYIEAATGDQPLVLLDDVFSELDEERARRLVECLPDSQIILTSATGTVPKGVDPSRILEIMDGNVHE